MTKHTGEGVVSTIQKGDMVMVVRGRPCCGATPRLGLTFIVTDIIEKRGHCQYCKARGAVTVAAFEKRSGIILSRLIKVDPPAKGELQRAVRIVRRTARSL
jgi:hypothetical protein